MPLQTLAPDVLLLQTNLTGTVADIDEDPDSPDASFLLAPTLQSAATKTLYFMDALQGAGYAMQDGGTAPATANFHGSTTGSGWQSGQVSPRFSWLDYNTQVARTALATTEPPAEIITTALAGNYFRSANAYTGSFAAGNWTLNMGVRGSATADFNLRWHVWASTDPTGATNVRQLNSSVIISATQTLSLTTTLVTINATWAAPAITLANEYLFFTPYLNITVAGTGNTQNIYLVKASTSRALTTTFSPAEPDTQARVSFPTPTYGLSSGAGLQEFRTLVRKKGTGTNPTATLALYESGSAISTLVNAQPISSGVGTVLSGTFDGTGRDMTQIEADVLGTGAVGGSVEVGAIEWNATTQVQQVDAGAFSDSSSIFGATLGQTVTDTDLRVSFPDPAETLLTGIGFQEFRVLVRKTPVTGTPTVRLELFYDGSFLAEVLSATNVTSTTGQIVSGYWNATLLPNMSGQGVELRIFGAGVSGGASVEVGAVEWNAAGFTPQVLASFLGDAARLSGAVLAGDATTVSAGVLSDTSSVSAPLLKGPTLQAGYLGPLTAGPYFAGNYAPQSIAATHTIYGVTLSSASSGGYERVKPNQILSVSGLSGTVADIDDDPDNPDGAFLHV